MPNRAWVMKGAKFQIRGLSTIYDNYQDAVEDARHMEGVVLQICPKTGTKYIFWNWKSANKAKEEKRKRMR